MRNRRKNAARFFMPLILLAVFLISVMVLSGIERGRSGLARIQLEETVRKTALTCYAAEGMYPPDLEYMKDRYGLHFDEKMYQVYYDVFGANLMPDITVLEKGGQCGGNEGNGM
ncbi:MAG: hypothetical protein PUE84_06180 [Firmicutes bacterium]|nr:hypothetical protein [Bacillota bacterium]